MTDDKELKDQRIPIMMTPSEVEAIDDWAFKNRIRSRGEAIRRLCQMGLIFDRELTPAVEMVVNHLRDSIAGKKPKLTPAQHQQMFQDMAISLFNAGTIFAKLDNDIPTEEAIDAVIKLYEYYKRAEKS
ncbi:hypothetical protein [Ochrobactrum sp. CGA5]|uniref:hypothetical protein n=1 Tax=Ochrobactrum sp. CGA5 TaxID=2583453 RepID=UPI001122AC3C|nr:hypothetical protein [Ochrobactrum sp. CGA5]